MKAQARFIVNYVELDEAERLSIKPPESIWEFGELYFKLSDVSCAFITTEGNISIYISGEHWVIKFEKELWEAITRELS